MLAVYMKFIVCLAVGLAGISLFLKALIDNFLTDRTFKDYEWSGRLSSPLWSLSAHHSARETSLAAVFMRLLTKIPPPRRVAELEGQLRRR